MSSGEETSGRPPDEAAEDQSTNEIGFRDVDEEGEYDESGGEQSAPGGSSGESESGDA
jgi:hypothetical protein